ncbi:MAG: hypothetical protein C0467_06660 [Planctomycetaceae bacterium]|nr:hypothetical protein [Planctomycetaceae bacterium]
MPNALWHSVGKGGILRLHPPFPRLGSDVPRFACPFCHALTNIPDHWQHPGFTCCYCHRPVVFPPGWHPAQLNQPAYDPANPPPPDFLPVIPPQRWGWTPWLVVLLGGCVIGSVVAFLVTEEVIWLMALGIPALTLLGILAMVWTVVGIRGRNQHEDGELHEEPPSGAS